MELNLKHSALSLPLRTLKPFGYKLGNDVYFFVDEMILINANKDHVSRLKLRATMSCLLNFLLEHYQDNLITDDQIMINVWEANDLRASTHRLWQVIRGLKLKLREIGITEDIFCRVSRSGFVVSNCKVVPIYRK